MPLVDLNLLSSTEILEILKKDVKDPQNIISLPLDQTTRESLREALRLVDKKARQFRPSDDRVLGQIDIIKSALNAPSFSEKVPSDKVRPMSEYFFLTLLDIDDEMAVQIAVELHPLAMGLESRVQIQNKGEVGKRRVNGRTYRCALLSHLRLKYSRSS